MGEADRNALGARAEGASKLLTKLSREHKRILVVTHIDADGLSSGSIAFQSLARKGAITSVRALPDLDPRGIDLLKNDRFDFYLFTDLGSGLIEQLTAALGESFMVVDHHQLPPEYASRPEILNAWNFGYDGGTDVCSATMAYLLAKTLDERNRDLSVQAVVGALGDRQDGGPGRSLTGLNREALDDSVELGLVTVAKDFLFHGRETRPIHEAMAMTYSPYIPGLSGAKDASLAALSNSGLVLKERGRWRSISELSTEEKQKLMEVLTSFAGSSGDGSALVSSLIGEVYTLQLEDALTPLRDAREYGTLLNACGRMDATDIGISICLGDRYTALSEALRLMGEYRSKLNKAIQALQMGGDRVSTHGDVTVVMGEEFIEERMTGSISSLLASSEKFKDKMVLVRARSGDSELKFSSRLGDSFPKEVNLGLIMKEAAEQVGGVGGGHSMAAGAKIPISKRDEFTRAVLEKVAA
ncbi:MAG: DHH family phosphoesterase [Thaumarchaeota archaeon]|nr:DHH family phosphoesterase [Nitrososphaerota archaeon]